MKCNKNNKILVPRYRCSYVPHWLNLIWRYCIVLHCHYLEIFMELILYVLITFCATRCAFVTFTKRKIFSLILNNALRSFLNRKCTYNLIYEYYLTEVRIGTGLPLLTKYHCTVVHILYTILLYVICVCACENVYYQIAKLKINVQCRYFSYLYPYEGQWNKKKRKRFRIESACKCHTMRIIRWKAGRKSKRKEV